MFQLSPCQICRSWTSNYLLVRFGLGWSVAVVCPGLRSPQQSRNLSLSEPAGALEVVGCYQAKVLVGYHPKPVPLSVKLTEVHSRLLVLTIQLRALSVSSAQVTSSSGGSHSVDRRTEGVDAGS